ncbi:hypothetical protein E2C01_047629 [Portunus trituberculatus]|uniref:Uncharacterized protein n=1 Tax=Portunus trituberculatus TaxID=210409 RepID=A0A5B7G139_PORTR|nr:hypothetical protein [Portunus trituberculatus]
MTHYFPHLPRLGQVFVYASELTRRRILPSSSTHTPIPIPFTGRTYTTVPLCKYKFGGRGLSWCGVSVGREVKVTGYRAYLP